MRDLAARVLAIGLAAAGLSGHARAASDSFSDWARSPHSQARLVALGPPADGGTARLAAIEIRLDPGYLTYWRQPGEAGLPPTLNTEGSRGIASVHMDFPAPRIFDEAGAQLFGYAGSVVLPLRIAVAEPDAPAVLAVALDYAVCAALCLPGRAELSLPLPPVTDPVAGAVVAEARAAVPRQAALGAAGTLAIEDVAPGPAATPPSLVVKARAQPPATLFVEGPEGWYFAVGTPTADRGILAFPVTIAERPAGSATAVDLRLTLVDGTGAIEVPARVDAGAVKP